VNRDSSTSDALFLPKIQETFGRNEFFYVLLYMYLYQQPLFRFLFVLISLIALFHLAALKYSLYWEWWWFDILMHFLGGLWVGITALWIARQYFVRFTLTHRSALILTLISFITIAVGWEFFELWAGVLIASNYGQDTVLDLFAGILGAIAAFLYVMKIIVWKKN